MKSPKVLTDRVVVEYLELKAYLDKVINRTRYLYNLYITVDEDKKKGVYGLQIIDKLSGSDCNNKQLKNIFADDVRKMYTMVSKMMVDEELSHIFV